jgi:hypothetical protein
MARTSSQRLPILVATLVMLCPGKAVVAQMIPIEDTRECSAAVDFLGVLDSKFEYPPAPFAAFSSTINILVENPDPDGGGSAQASAFQFSSFFSAAISMSGGTSGNWTVHGADYTALASATIKFRVDTCIEYQLDTQYEPGDLGTERRLRLAVPGTNLNYEEPQAPSVPQHFEGRLPAGTYEIEGHSYIISSLETTQGPVYSAIWTCQPCITTLIWTPPADQTVGCGGTAVFTVQPTAPVPPTLTYQWRQDLVPITNNGHFAGVTTPMLTIQNACDSDAGYYDVVLSDGTIVEPSRLAQLSVATTTGVEETDEISSLAFSVRLAGPNPFVGSTSFRYATVKPQRATIAVYNAAGARVRTLVDHVLSGAGIVTWEGTTDAGARVPSGIYFLRVEAGSVRESRKVVLLR